MPTDASIPNAQRSSTPSSGQEMERRFVSLPRQSLTVPAVGCAVRRGLWQRSFADRFPYSSCSGMKDQRWISSGLRAGAAKCVTYAAHLFTTCRKKRSICGQFAKVQPLTANTLRPVLRQCKEARHARRVPMGVRSHCCHSVAPGSLRATRCEVRQRTDCLRAAAHHYFDRSGS